MAPTPSTDGPLSWVLSDLQGRPASIEIDGEFLQVVRVRRRGLLGEAGTSPRAWHAFFQVTLENRAELTLIHDRAEGRWYAKPEQRGPGVLLRFPTAPYALS